MMCPSSRWNGVPLTPPCRSFALPSTSKEIEPTKRLVRSFDERVRTAPTGRRRSATEPSSRVSPSRLAFTTPRPAVHVGQVVPGIATHGIGARACALPDPPPAATPSDGPWLRRRANDDGALGHTAASPVGVHTPRPPRSEGSVTSPFVPSPKRQPTTVRQATRAVPRGHGPTRYASRRGRPRHSGD